MAQAVPMLRKRLNFALLSLVTFGLLLMSCKSSRTVAQRPEPQPMPVEETQPAPPPPPREQPKPDTDVVRKPAFELRRIHFDFDQFDLTPQAIRNLELNAEVLRAYPDANILIEGHCDERGTVEYNLALGDKRARAAKAYLVSLGIAAQRISTISFGKERPLDHGHNESAWAQNRRAEFIRR